MSQNHKFLKLKTVEITVEPIRKGSDAPTDASGTENSQNLNCCEESKNAIKPIHLKLPENSLTLSGSQHTSPALSPTASPKKKISISDFTLLELIGMGAYSKVALVEHIATGQKYAMKVMEKKFLIKVYLFLLRH